MTLPIRLAITALMAWAFTLLLLRPSGHPIRETVSHLLMLLTLIATIFTWSQP